MGHLKLTATGEGIAAVKYLFGKHADEKAAEKLAVEETEGAVKWSETLQEDGSEASSHLRVCCEWLDAYFAGKLLVEDPPPPPKPKIAFSKKGSVGLRKDCGFDLVCMFYLGGFFHTVWSVLSNTSIGETLSYKELAMLSGSPRAARAVGQAVKSHCIPILVPCHRVVNSSAGGGGAGGRATAGNYSGGDGTATKTWLLEHEKKMVDQT